MVLIGCGSRLPKLPCPPPAGSRAYGHQGTSSDLISENVIMLVIALPAEQSHLKFLLRVTVCMKSISSDFDISDPTSGEFCYLSIIGQKNKIEMLLFLTNAKLNQRPAGGTESAPLLDFLNNSKTVADIDTKFGIPYPTPI